MFRLNKDNFTEADPKPESRYNTLKRTLLDKRVQYQRNELSASETSPLQDYDNSTYPLYLLDQNRHKFSRFFSNVGKSIQAGTDETNSLHNSSRVVIILAQYLGLFPVLGIAARNARGLYFRWTSKIMMFSLLILGFCLALDVLLILRAIKMGLTYHNIGKMFHMLLTGKVDFVFLASLTSIYVLFIQLAAKWPTFAYEWEEVEKRAGIFGYTKNRLAKKFKTLTVTIMILALVEHISSIVTNVVDALPCIDANSNLAKAYFMNSYKHVFTFVEYDVKIAFGVAILMLVMSCAWNFIDIFIIIMSIAMAERYKQFNQLLQSVNRKVMPITFWQNMREEYNQLSCLTRKLDELLSPIVLLSFANNLYFICLQLFNSLKPMASTWHATYFVYSFSYLVLRTTAVSLYAAAIYEQSKQPKSVLFSVPSESYCTEVARLLTQIISDDLALTGCRFFSITRTLVLTVAGTIVTYEIVLVQFNTVTDENKRNTTIICV